MILTLLALTAPPALAGYGDVINNRPNWSQREMLTLTNLVRVDPEAWSYACSMNQWKSDERRPKDPLYYHSDLTQIAQLHSEDMELHGFMDHDSWDGTEFGDRVWPYYDGRSIGENVAWGYNTNESALFDGWMCSSGHRKNIMSASFEDLGVGIKGKYYTQDFGGGAGTRHVPVAMGIHSPEVPSRSVTFTATWSDDSAPAELVVETAQACDDMVLIAGSYTLGAWETHLDADEDCTAYRFSWMTDDGDVGSLPTNGAYLYGKGCPLWTEIAPGGCAPEEPEPTETGDTGIEDDGTDLDDGIVSEPRDCPETAIDRNGDCERDAGDDADIPDTLFSCAAASGSGGLWLTLMALGWRRREPFTPSE
jgi:hypothetical protein